MFSSLITHLNLDDQTLSLVVLSLLLAFLLSGLLVLAYEYTSRDVVPLDHFMQSFILMALITAVIMQSIGDSLARSFGIFGALAILRFRMQISSPRNIAFIFAAMAIGISCGVYSFLTAIVGTFSFIFVAILLRFSPYSKKQSLGGTLRFNLFFDEEIPKTFDNTLKKHCRSSSIRRYRLVNTNEGQKYIEYQYKILLKKELDGVALLKDLEAVQEISELRLTFTDAYDEVND